MQKSDLRMLIVIWIAAFLLAIGVAVIFYQGILRHDLMSPGPENETSSWIHSPATDIARDVHRNWAWTMAVVMPFYFGPVLILIYSMVRYSRRRNPRAATFHENVPLEVFWTIVPAGVLVAMAIPAYGVLRKMENPPHKPDVVVDIVGAQFYWQYNLAKYDVTVTDDGTGTSPLVLPVDKVIYVTGQSHQVNHAWWVPSFGVKFDVIPGRVNNAWFTTEREGFFKGQCAELCGALHAFMWIHVKVVPEREFYEWLHEKGATFPVEDREKVREYLGEEVAAAAFAELPQ